MKVMLERLLKVFVLSMLVFNSSISTYKGRQLKKVVMKHIKSILFRSKLANTSVLSYWPSKFSSKRLSPLHRMCVPVKYCFNIKGMGQHVKNVILLALLQFSKYLSISVTHFSPFKLATAISFESGVVTFLRWWSIW